MRSQEDNTVQELESTTDDRINQMKMTVESLHSKFEAFEKEQRIKLLDQAAQMTEYSGMMRDMLK